jgi:hypothetical protein
MYYWLLQTPRIDRSTLTFSFSFTQDLNEINNFQLIYRLRQDSTIQSSRIVVVYKDKLMISFDKNELKLKGLR